MAIIFISCEKDDDGKESEKEIKTETELFISTPDTLIVGNSGYGVFVGLMFYNNELSSSFDSLSYVKYNGTEITCFPPYGGGGIIFRDNIDNIKCSLILYDNKNVLFLKEINVEKGQRKTVKITKEEYARWINNLIK